MNTEINYKNNPLNGVGLKKLLTEIVDHYGFKILDAYLNINCFKTQPSIDSSMKFLKKTLKVLVIFFALLVAILYITDTDYLLKAVRTIYLKGHTTAYLEDYREFDNQTIPVTKDDNLYINMYSQFNTYSMSGLLASISQLQTGDVENLPIDPGEFTDKYIFIGA